MYNIVVFYGLTIDGLTMGLLLEFYFWAYYGFTIRILCMGLLQDYFSWTFTLGSQFFS